MVLASCTSGSSEPEPAVTAGPSPTIVPRVQATPLALADRVTLYAADPGDSGGAVAAGDFNGDGFTDVLFTAAFADGPANQRPDAGEAYVFLGPFRPGETRDAAAGEQNATIYGSDDGDQTGRAAAAGDLNGDGIDDIILGAPFGDGPEGQRTDSGEVHVLFGSPDLGRLIQAIDLREGSDLTLYGRAEEDLAGFAVTTANLNGDEAADLVVGAFWADGPLGDRSKAGEVYAIFGSAGRTGSVDLAAGEQDITVYGAAPDHLLGESVAAGDVNGDGLDDLVISAPFAPASGGAAAAGQTYVIYSPSPPQIDLSAQGQDVTIYGVDEGDQLGHTVAVGDTNGDGAADILLTAVSSAGEGNESRLAGEAALVLGGALPAVVDVAAGQGDVLIYGADSVDRLGRSSALGDTDGDGRAELLLGAPGADGLDESLPESGEFYILSQPRAADVVRLPAEARVYAGDDEGDVLASGLYGRTPLQAADMDGDGTDEILVTAPRADGPGDRRPDCGEAYILFVASD